MSDQYVHKAVEYLNTLCSVEPNRRTGSPGNREATRFVAKTIAPWRYEVDTTPFACLDFEEGEASLRCGDSSFQVLPNHFSQGCDVTAELRMARTVDELERCECAGRVLLLTGEICAEPLMPK
ncbi:MAG: Zn-dependent exopeptidase M28, partial [Chitinivibrionales bacterium]|nr:Zn-dependent exopeptidase M28 [Chitinivibrionales bacterium]